MGARVIRDAMRPDRTLVARDDGRVVGVCGFHESGAGAADLSWRRLRVALPMLAALRAMMVLSVLARTEEAGVHVLDGICVDAEDRGTGIGTKLLDAAEARARERGAAAVRLSVIEGNPRAKALYRRRGFRATGSGALGVLGVLYGFDRYTVMEKKVTP